MFKQSLPSLVALVALATTQACASAAQPSGEEETSGGGQASTSGATSTAGTGTTSSGGVTGAAGGASSAVTPGGGVSSIGGASATSGGGASGASVNGGAAGGSVSAAGASAGTAGAAAATPFSQVESLLAKRCTGSKCHGTGTMQLAFAAATGSALHSLLTTPIPSSAPHCVGVTLVTPNNTSSPLVQIVMSGGKIACTQPKTESVGPMPDKCTTTATTATGVCLTTAEIQIISDWISAGAPD